MLWRQCTADYKIAPVNKYIKERLGIGRKSKAGKLVNLWFGLSVDEMLRMRRSELWWAENKYPLIEKRLNRQDVIKYVRNSGLPEPQRSACYFCPYHSREYWRWLKKHHPNEFDRAVEFDKIIRNWPNTRMPAYLHRDCVPLNDIDNGQLDMFDDMIDECDGVCGI